MDQKWEGKVSATLPKASPDQIWSLFIDFFNLHKWFSNLSTCYGVHGNNGEPGCIRYCAGSSIPSNDVEVSWSKERLIAVDHHSRHLTYEIVDSNIGFESYVSTVNIVPHGHTGCSIEWSFSVKAVKGMELDGLLQKYELGLRKMAHKMEESVLHT